MGVSSVILLTTGVPGAGKTYVRAARFLVDDFLINSTGKHISNFPLNVERISEDVSKRLNRTVFGLRFRKKVTPEDVASRLEIIPDEVLQSWRAEISGPWDYFKGRDLRYCHIAIDEIQNFVSASKSPEYIQKWDEFLGEVRHRGCSVEGLTQDIDQVDKVFTGRATVRLEILPCEVLRDPFFKIPLIDWYELKASFTGSFHKCVFEIEKRKSGSRWVSNNSRRFLIVPEYFVYYNSFSASLQEKSDGSVSENRAPEYEYQKRTRLGLLWWFFSRNFLSLFFRIGTACFLIWLLFFGGLSLIIDSFVASLVASGKANTKKKVVRSVSLPPASVPSPQQTISVQHIPPSKPSESDSKKDSDEKKTEEEEVKELLKSPDRFSNSSFFKIVFLSPDVVILQNGLHLTLNEKIYNPEGLYHDLSVDKIDSSRRLVFLSDGTVLRM